MVSSTRQAIACILVTFSALVFARAQTVQPKEPTATITGKVTIKGKGAPGIFIGLRRQEQSYSRQRTGFRTVTDNEGKYRIENVTAGAYAVIPVAPAYVSDEISEKILIVNKDETIENIDFVLVRGGAITGKVVDAEGRPVVEEEVTAIPDGNTPRNYSRHLGARTDDRGIYRIFGLPAGRYRVAAGSETFSRFQRASHKRTFHPGTQAMDQATVIEVSEGSEATNVDLNLGAIITTYTASGRIIDAQTGQPVANVGYNVTRYHDENSSTSTGSDAVSNSRGEFRLENLSPGKYGVGVQDREKGEARADEVPFEVVDHNVTGLVVRMERAASISGVIVLEGPEDKSVREQLTKTQIGASVSNETNPRRGYGSSARVAPDGTFRITGLGGGQASLHAYSSSMFRIARVERNGVIMPRDFEIKPSEQITGLRVFVQYGNATIRGSVKLADGTLPPGARFYIWVRRITENPESSAHWTDSSRQMDARGQFVIENLAAGTYEVHAGVALQEGRIDVGHINNAKQEVVVTAGSTSNITITVALTPPPPRP